MIFRSGSVACALILAAVALGVAGCGGSSKPDSSTSSTTSASGAASASDKATGVTVSVSGDQVTVSRSATSTAGTGGTAGQVACTTDYRKLVTAAAEPAPTLSWYAATLITWPAANAKSTATLSHILSRDPDLCIAETSASQTQIIVYFRAGVKAGIAKLQQAGQATAALRAAAQAAVAAESGGSFPDATKLVKAVSALGLYVKQAATVSAATETGTLYLVTGGSTKTQVVFALRGGKGVVHTATQGLKGSPKLATAKSG